MTDRSAVHLPPQKNLVLIGLRGSGKSTVGRLLASRLGCDFVDSDEQIERAAGRPVGEILQSAGEPAFRDDEARAVELILSRAGQVVSLGGGAVLRESTRRRIRECSLCAGLGADPGTLPARLPAHPRAAALRPALTHLSGEAEIEYLLAQRQLFYEELADATIDTAGRTPAQVAEAIVSWLGTRTALR